jgi:hypothetical protein
MTAPTPKQMRALADEHSQEAAEYELDRTEKQEQPEYGDVYEYEDKITWHHNTAAALRAAADQLEAVRALERIYVDAWDSDAVAANALDAILTADTASQEQTGLDAKLDVLGLRDADEPARPDSLPFPHAKADKLLAPQEDRDA